MPAVPALHRRLEELESELAQRRRADEAFRMLVAGTARAAGEAFFPVLVCRMCDALGARAALVSEIVSEDPLRVRTRAAWDGAVPAPPVEYEVAGTPCAIVFAEGEHHCSAGVQDRFPDDENLLRLGAESYAGVRLDDSKGQAIGHLCVVDGEPCCAGPRAVAVLRSFAGRAAGELERLRERPEQRFSQFAVENTSDSVFWVRPDASFAYVNHAACTMLEYSAEELLSLRVADIDPDYTEEAWAEKFQRIKAAGSLSYTGRHRSRTGRIMPAEITANYVQVNEEEFLCAFCRDITERTQAEVALRASDQRARTLVQVQKTLLDELDHRVKNNLAALLALIDLYRRTSSDVHEFSRRLGDRIIALKLVHELIARAASRTTDLRTLLEALGGQFAEPAPGQAPAPNPAPDSVSLRGPPLAVEPRQAGAMAMLLQELLANSRKHGALSSPEGRVEIDWTVREERPSSVIAHLGWRERGGPTPARPQRRGLGLGLIDGFARADLGGSCTFSFDPPGFCFDLECELDRTRDPGGIGPAAGA